MDHLAKITAINQQLAECKTVKHAKILRDAADAVGRYAKLSGATTKTVNYATAIKTRFERRLGELLKAMPKAGGAREKGTQRGKRRASKTEARQTLKELGINSKLSSRTQRLADVPLADFEALISEVEAEAEKEMGSNKIVSRLLSNAPASRFTGDHESFTPPEYIAAAIAVMGGIDLDPASNQQAQETVNAKKFFALEDNGLAQKWGGRVFLNPPYSQPEIALFIKKLLDEIAGGSVTQAVLLTNDNTDTDWFQAAAQQASAVCFVHTRIKFMKSDGTRSSPTNGQSFFYFGEAWRTFVKHFEQFGLLMRIIR